MRCSPAVLQPPRARPPPRPASPARDGESRMRCRTAPQNKGAWPRILPAEPEWWRYCPGKRAAYRTLDSILREFLTRQAHCARHDRRGRQSPHQDSRELSLVDGYVPPRIFGTHVFCAGADEAVIFQLLDYVGGPTADA